MSQPTRVALVGFGWAGRRIWLPRLRAHGAYQVVAVVEPDAGAREQAAGAGVPRCLADLDALDPDTVDLAVVAVPNHLHTSVACTLLRQGIAVFLEKPVCLTVAEADQLVAAERDGGAVLLAGSAARYRADVLALHDLAGDIAPVRHVDLAWVRARGVPGAGGWFTDRRLAGGGALVDLGWHLLDAVGPVLGRPVFEQVVGTVSADFVNNRARQAAWRGPGNGPGAWGDVEDTARGFLVTADGVSVALRASWASHEARDITRITVDGEDGTASLSCTFGFSTNRQADSVLTRTRNGVAAPVSVPAEPVGVEYDRQLDELPALLAAPESRGVAVAQAREMIAVIERFYDSAASHRRPARVPEAQGV